MSLILDQYGFPAASTQRFARAADPMPLDRPWMPTRLDDITNQISGYERRVLVAVSRLMMENWGPMRAIGRQIPMYSVGNAWVPSNQSKSPRFKNKAEQVIREEFCPIADIRGRPFSKLVYDIAHELVRDGECFVLKTSYDNGFPALQILPSHRIGSGGYARKDKVTEGPFKGARITDGIITNKLGQVIAYRYTDPIDEKPVDIAAQYIEHIFDSDYSEGVRGYPAATHGLNDARDSLQSHEWERFNLLFRSAHTIIETSITGAADDEAKTFFDSDDQGAAPRTRAQMLLGGMVRHLQAGAGCSLESLKHDTPGEVYESYNDRMIMYLAAGIPWPVSFIIGGNRKGGGTQERRDIEQARRTIADLQGTMEPAVRRLVGYATAKLQKMGRIEQSADWWRWSFGKPQKLTIDDGRVSKATLDMHARGVISDEQLLEDLGGDHDEFFYRKFAKAVAKKKMFDAANAEVGGTLDPRIMGMFTPNDPGLPPEEEEETEPKEDEKAA